MVFSRRGTESEVLQSTRKVSNTLRPRVASLEHLLMSSVFYKVAQAIAYILGTAADITHEVLFIGVDLLDLAPVPGLRPAALLLLNIWDASQQVKVSFLPLTNCQHQFN